MQFLDFRIEGDSGTDYVTVTDGDGTQLFNMFGGQPESDWGREITSHTETVHVTFYTDSSVTYEGWRLSWGELD